MDLPMQLVCFHLEWQVLEKIWLKMLTMRKILSKQLNCCVTVSITFSKFLILVFILFPRFILCVKCCGCHNNLAPVFHNSKGCSQKSCARSFGCYSISNKGIIKKFGCHSSLALDSFTLKSFVFCCKIQIKPASDGI